MRPKPALAALSAAVAAVGIAACGGSGADKAGGTRESKPTVLTLANGNGDPRELEPYAAAVARRSGGTIRIVFRDRWRKGETDYEAGLIRDVKAGKADLGWAGTRAFDDVGVSSFDPLHAPLLIDSLALERKVLESPLALQMLVGIKPAGVVGIGILPGPMRKPLGVGRLMRPEDYRGETIALQRSQVGEQTLEALGAKGAPIAAMAPVNAYDGVEQQISSIGGNGYDRVGSHLTANVTLWPRPVVLFANAKALSGLDARQRAALTGAVKDALGPTVTFEQKDAAEATGILCRRGVTFETAAAADLTALRRAVQPVYDQLERDAHAKTAVAAIRAIRAELGVPADAPTCTGTGAPVQAAAGTTPVDGVYRSDVTLEQLRHAPGFDSGEDNPGNAGHFRMQLRDGRFRITGQADHATQLGTYAVKGDVLTFNWNGEGSYAYRWNLYRGALTLRKLHGGPTIFQVHPWRRLGDAAAAKRTPLDGVWTVTTTRKEAAKFMDPGDLVSENWGRWRYTLSRGRMYYTQSSEGHTRWTRASYTVKDHVFTYTVTDFGGDAPHGASEKTGEVFSFRWSRYRDRLSLGPVKDAVSPRNFSLKPWRRVGDAP
jgi:TRAP-type C4-dicarboxylate transport system substrate-binding protein